jgi:nucleotidyltransferase/DNA polymerase involved in DNA repair
MRDERLATAYSSADVFVFPSLTDTFGLVLLEALASGLPVAANPVVGPLDVIGDSGAGILDANLGRAALAALSIPRELARARALTFNLRESARQFVDNVFAAHRDNIASRGTPTDPREAKPEPSVSETTFSEDLTDPVQIEAAVIAMADDVWAWCEKANARGRTVTVKIKWADFQISTRSRSMETTIRTREKLHQLALGLIRSVLPLPKGIRLVGVTLSNFQAQSNSEAVELPLS